MDKFLLVIFFIIKVLMIVIFPILLYIFKKYLKKTYFYLEIIFIVVLSILYLINFSYVVDSNISNIITK